MSSPLIPEGPGSASGAPNLPEGFTDTFTSRYIDTGDVRLHAVIGGDGPPLLLIHGWPGSWYYWRLVMPALARDFEVIAVDQRGIGLSDKPEEGYDSGTLANDLVGLMDALGHEQFAVVGVDTGMLIGYALAADHPDRVVRLAVGEAPLPGISPPSPLVLPDQIVDRLWHIPFNQLKETNEKLVRGREDIFFGAEFSASAGTNKLPDEAVKYYVDGLASSPEALHGSFQLYRAFGATTAQNERAQDPPAADARPGDGRSGELGCNGRGHDEAHRRRRADPRHSRHRPLACRAGSRRAGRGADRVSLRVPARRPHAQPSGQQAEIGQRGPGRWTME